MSITTDLLLAAVARRLPMVRFFNHGATSKYIHSALGPRALVLRYPPDDHRNRHTTTCSPAIVRPSAGRAHDRRESRDIGVDKDVRRRKGGGALSKL